MHQNDRFCSKTNWLWPKTLAAFFILSICLFCQYNLYRMSRGKVTGDTFEMHLNTRWKQFAFGRPLVIGSLKTYLYTRWKQGLFNFSWTKKNTSPAVDNALCSHVAQNDCDYCEWLLPIVYIVVLFIYATNHYIFLSPFSTRLVQEILLFPPINHWQGWV